MSWIERLRNRSDAEKRKILWIILLVALLILILIWILVGNYKPYNSSGGNPFFQSIGDAFKNTKNIKINPKN